MKNQFLLMLCLFSSMFATAQWTRTNGLEGARISNLIYVGDTLIANAGELYYSVDDGEHWAALNATPGEQSVELKTFDKALVLKCYSHNFHQTSLWRSQDIGQTWVEIKIPDTIPIYEFFKAGPLVYVSNNDGVYRTSNDGATWEQMLDSPVNQFWVEAGLLTVVSYNELSGTNRLLQSEDGGGTWIPQLYFPENTLDFFQHENHQFLFLQNPLYCWYSKDYGENWEKRMLLTPFKSTSEICWSDGSMWWANFGSLFYSHNQGETWGYNNVTRFENPINTVVAKGDTVWVGTQDQGVFRRVHPDSSWQSKNKGLIAAQANHLSSTSTGLYASYGVGLSKLGNNDQDWKLEKIDFYTPYGSYVGDLSYLESGENRVILHGWNILIQKPQSAKWQKSVIETPDSLYKHFGRLHAVYDHILAYSYTSNELFISLDHGAHFKTLFPKYQLEPLYINDYYVDNNVIYLLDILFQRLFYSTDFGQSWKLLSTLPTPDCSPFSPSRQLFIRDSTILVFPSVPTTYAMMFSPDLGSNWECFDLKANERPWGEARIYDFISFRKWLFLATSTGVFATQDRGHTWIDWNEGLKGKMIQDLTIHDQDIWASCIGYGIWKRPLYDLSLISEAPERVPDFPLAISPNPAVDFCTLTLPEPGVLKVWDLNGRLIQESDHPAGTAVLELSNWPSGTYQVLFFGAERVYRGKVIRL